MADPATQFQPAGLNVPYQYTPVSTHLASPMQLQPVSYAGLQSAFEGAQKALSEGALNPAVRAKWQLAAASAKAGQNLLAESSKDPRYQYLQSVSGDEFHQIAGANAGANWRMFQGPRFTEGGNPAGDSGGAGGSGEGKQVVNPATVEPGGKEPPPTGYNPPPTYGGSTQTTDQTTVKPALPVQPGEQKPVPIQGNPPGMQQQGTSSTQPASNYFAANAPVNAPSVDQFGQNVRAQVRAVGPGGEVNPTLGATTDTAQLAQLAQNQPQPQDQGQAGPVGQQLMNQWQQRNTHPVASVQDAMQWAKTFDTRITDATYMPHGGPMNQPAYAFHMKGGGTNMVPLQQMVQNGFAPHVAGSNLSMTLSAADQVQQQSDQAQAGQPPSAAPTDQQMQPTGAVGGQGQPPPAAPTTPTGVTPPQQPGGPVAQTPEQQNYLTQQTAVTTPGGNVNPALRADNTDHNGTPGIGQATDNPNITANPDQTFRNVMGVDRNVIHDANPTADAQRNETGDPYVGTFNGYKWYQDHDTGMRYTTRPSEVSIWNQGRFWENADHFVDTPLPANLLRKNLSEWRPDIPYSQIMNMSMPELQKELGNAFYIKNIVPSQLSPTNNPRIDAVRTQILNAQRILNVADALGEPSSYSEAKMESNRQYLESKSLEGGSGIGGGINRARAFWSGMWSGAKGENPALTYLDNQVNQMKAAVGSSPGVSKEEQSADDIMLNNVFSGSGSWKTNLQSFINARTKDYQRLVNGSMENRERVRAEDVENVGQLITGHKIFDPSDAYRRPGDPTGPIPNGPIQIDQRTHAANKAAAGVSPTPAPTPTPTPTPRPTPTPTPRPSPTPVQKRFTTEDEFNNLKVGERAIGPDGKTYTKKK